MNIDDVARAALSGDSDAAKKAISDYGKQFSSCCNMEYITHIFEGEPSGLHECPGCHKTYGNIDVSQWGGIYGVQCD